MNSSLDQNISEICSRNPDQLRNLICRACLTLTEPIVSLNEHPIDSEDLLTLSTMFEFVTNIIAPDKNYPTNICCSCLEELLISYKFKRKCEENHQLLKRIQQSKKVIPAQSTVKPMNNVLVPNTNSDTDTCVQKTYEKLLENGHDEDFEQAKDTRYEEKPSENEVLVNNLDTFSCNKCSSKFYSREELRDHTLEQHLGEGLYRNCEICQETVAKRRFKQHLQFQHGIEDETLVCVDCFLLFPTQKELEIHQTEAHDIKFPYRCKFCQLGFLTVATLMTHVQKQHSRLPGFHCAHCNFNCYSKYAIRVHVLLHIKKTLFNCKICDKTLKSAVALTNHEDSHGIGKPYQCEKCFKMYKTNKALTAHQTLHNPTHRFECPVCAKIFSFSQNLRQHFRMIHAGFKLPPLHTLVRTDLL